MDREQKIKIFCKKRSLIFGCVFVLCSTWLLLFLNRNMVYFYSDECDNFLGGMIVANGGDIYKDYTSQHMPVLYYICAFISRLGAESVKDYRMGFYVLLSLYFCILFLRYSKFYGKLMMVLYPILFICSMRFFDFGYAVLSEQLWAQGAVVLLLEYFIYLKSKKITIGSSCWISFAIFIAFGSAFMAVFSISIICLGVLINEVILQKNKSVSISKGIINVWQRLWRLIIIVLVPFAIVLFKYFISGNLYNAFYGAYVVNREYYSQYMGGRIDSPLTVLKVPIKSLVLMVGDIENSLWYIEIIVFGFFLLIMLLRKSYLEAVITFSFTLLCGVRGMIGFHCIQVHAIFMLMLAFLISQVIYRIISEIRYYEDHRERYVRYTYFVIVILVMFLPIYKPTIANYREIKYVKGENEIEYMELELAVKKLTDEGEKIHENLMNPAIELNTKTFPVTSTAGCPWIYEAYKDKIFKDLKKENPRIVLYDEDMEVWGSRFGDFAWELCEYFEDNYKESKEFPELHIRKDYYEEAEKILIGGNQ